MITLLIGENSFEIERALTDIAANFDGSVEKISGSELQLAQLPDILMGVSLFATARVIIIRNLSENKVLWSVFGDWLSKISDDIHLVLVESKPDKRTTTYKALKDLAIIKEFQSWTDRDYIKAEKWAVTEAKKFGYELSDKLAQVLVRRVGVDQWQLFHALEKLALVDVVSADVIKDVIEPNLVENVFELLETALKGDIKELKKMLRVLEQSEDVFRLSALLSAQVFQLAAVISVSFAGQRTDNVAKDFGIHPYVVQKLESIARRLGKSGVTKVVKIFAEADDDMKLSKADPWLLIERALIKTASL